MAALPEQPGSELVTDWTHSVLDRLHMEGGGGGVEREGGEDEGGEGGERGLGCIGMACVRVTKSQWRDACTLLETGTVYIHGTYMYIHLYLVLYLTSVC